MCCQCENLAGCFFSEATRALAAWGHTGKNTWPDLFACDRAERQASAHCLPQSEKALWRAAPPVESNQHPQWSTDGSPTGHTVRTQTTEGCYCTVRSHLRGRDVERGPLTSGQCPRCCDCEQRRSLSQPACASVCARFECGHSESERPKWKERGPLSHLRSFWAIVRSLGDSLCPFYAPCTAI